MYRYTSTIFIYNYISCYIICQCVNFLRRSDKQSFETIQTPCYNAFVHYEHASNISKNFHFITPTVQGLFLFYGGNVQAPQYTAPCSIPK